MSSLSSLLMGTDDPRWDVIYTMIGPFLGAMATSAFIIMLSNSMKGRGKLLMQWCVLGPLCGYAAYQMHSLSGQTELDFWNKYHKLSFEYKYFLALFVIGASYFGGALYVSNVTIGVPEKEHTKHILSTPATDPLALELPYPTSLPSNEKEFFEGMFQRFTDEIISDIELTYNMPPEAVKWCRDMIDYTVAGGKMNRGMATVSVIDTLAKWKGKELTIKDRVRAAALGWCIEFLQAFFLVADDVMDDSVTRRGQPCWFRRPDVKLIAINDSFILESCVYMILKRYFAEEDYYPQLVDLFLETTRQTELGQLLDLTSQPLDGKIDLSRFTMERYTSIVKYKTAFYSFYLPVAAGMISAGINSSKQYDQARAILVTMGEYFQIQDDYLDCYGKPEVIGKIGTDIQDNKCSWLVVTALKKVNKKQKQVLVDNYGQHGPEKIERVKALYRELDLEKEFQRYEEESFQLIKKLIAEVPELPNPVFEYLLNKIYKRSK